MILAYFIVTVLATLHTRPLYFLVSIAPLTKPRAASRSSKMTKRSSTPRFTSNQVYQTPKVVNRTPSCQVPASTPHRLPRPTQALRAPLVTPHAIRALQQRCAAAQPPSQRWKRSGRQYRKTPRDILRDLSKSMYVVNPAVMN